MGRKYASEKKSFGFCDRCSFRYPLKDMKRLMIKDTLTQIRVCPSCYEPSQPQLQLGKYPVVDAIALQNPRPDVSYTQSGLDTNGYPASGSRSIQWGWSPVGGASQFDAPLTPNYLVTTGYVGTVTTS